MRQLPPKPVPGRPQAAFLRAGADRVDHAQGAPVGLLTPIVWRWRRVLLWRPLPLPADMSDLPDPTGGGSGDLVVS